MLMTIETHAALDLRSQIVWIGRGAEQIDGDILRTGPGLVVNPSFNSWPDMTGDAGDLFVRGLDPTIVRRLDVMTTGTEFRMVRKRNGQASKRNGSGH